MIRRAAAYFLTLLAVTAMAAEPGLSVRDDGVLLKDGKPYRGIGINYFNCFLRTLAKGDDTSYDAGFATLAEKKIPFARFAATGFWPRDMKLYREDRDEYFRRLDGVVKSAEQHNVGLIADLFWYYGCVPDIVGEPMDQWGNPRSKTQAFMRDYVRDVVTRYKDSPAIWGWEMGNEFSLSANLPNAKDHTPKIVPQLGTATNRSERDYLTFEIVRSAFIAFATEVRKYDAHRIITSGDSFPRLSAWHLRKELKWTNDTPEQFAEILAAQNPDPLNVISLHAYEDDDQRFKGAMAVSGQLKKPVFVGEFGSKGTSQPEKDKVLRLLRGIEDSGIPLAAVWVFDLSSQLDFNITADNERAWQLDLIRETNARMAGQ